VALSRSHQAVTSAEAHTIVTGGYCGTARDSAGGTHVDGQRGPSAGRGRETTTAAGVDASTRPARRGTATNREQRHPGWPQPLL
jgi:hypothetical protein